MLDREKFDEIVAELAQEIPEKLYEKLNGGVIVLDRAKLHPSSIAGSGHPLYVMGEYNRSREMGSYIAIYFGSYNALYGDRDVESLRGDLQKTLRHEFRHHIETLAGDKSLILEDKANLERYLSNKPELNAPGRKFHVVNIIKFPPDNEKK